MSNELINNKYEHKVCEQKAKNDLFSVQKKLNEKALKANKLFSILLPPPNVTGKLHIGHAWNVTIQDCLIRYNTLKGIDSYWICGMDHAGIATQTKYESSIKKEKQKLSDDRNENIKNLYKWCQDNANSIRSQWQSVGCFLDYEKEWFTLEDKSNKVVLETFVRLYNDKLIYRAKKLVNWDTYLKTAISNIEVIKKDTNTKMYTIKYFFENSNEYMSVSTTRPETIFVDECLVVNPNDSRYKKYLTKKVINPLTKKLIPVIADEYVDKDFGTGVMKCTPAHDFNDYELGLKYNMPIISCFNEDGTTNELAVGFENLKIAEARKQVVEFFKKNNLLKKEEDIVSSVGYSERSGVVVEPMMSYQWFISMKEYANKIIENQKTENKVVFYPQKFEKMLINWLSNINDWCISRQLWWGHQIPVWYKKNSDEIYVGVNPPKDVENYVQDNDVLDTWFSSGLWPVITAEALDSDSVLFPTDILVTAFDIIFFWVSRMLFFSLYLKKRIPFKNVYITGLIRDSQNRKMSKSLGNGIDPNDVVEQYGADSLRLFLLSSSSPGEDLQYSEQKLKSCWSFINKIWNSLRFININFKDYVFDINNVPKEFSNFDKWILNKFNSMFADFKKQFDKYNFLVAIKKLIEFAWDDYCNNYIELNKSRKENLDAYKWTLIYLIRNIIILLHPICPFVTNELYNNLNIKDKKTSILYESVNFKQINASSCEDIEATLLILNRVRTFCFDNKVNKSEQVNIALKILDKSLKVTSEMKSILAQAKIEIIDNVEIEKPDFVESNFSILIVNKQSLISKNETVNDKEKIMAEIKKLEFEVERCDKMLSNENFVKKAPKTKIEEEQEKRKKYFEKLQNLKKIVE